MLTREPNAEGRMTLACDACPDVCWPLAPRPDGGGLNALKVARACGWLVTDDLTLCPACNRKRAAQEMPA